VRHRSLGSQKNDRITPIDTVVQWGLNVYRYNWHIAGSLDWPFPMLKYKFILKIKYTEAILSNSTRKLLRFEITKMLIAV